ncbi:hypothetical protein F5I97DRAFT_344439 [Phlebopus sp. FC_14]|nr:hypothetical protein F5I97DRAFT_344439 [Phlebopus sp. FC_14]
MVGKFVPFATPDGQAKIVIGGSFGNGRVDRPRFCGSTCGEYVAPSRYKESEDCLISGAFATYLESLRPWLEKRGYYLYKNGYETLGKRYDDPVYTYPSLETDGETRLPYSLVGGDPEHFHRTPHRLPSPTPDRVAFAQDAQHRHVTLKLMKDGSAEYKIYRHLSEAASLYTSDSEEFDCVIPPLDFIDLDGYWFIVIPRWGDSVLIPWFNSVHEVLRFIHCSLKVEVVASSHRLFIT